MFMSYRTLRPHNHTTWLPLAALLFFGIGCPKKAPTTAVAEVQTAPAANLPMGLADRLQAMIELLEAGQYRAVIEDFVHPDDLADIKEFGGIDRIIDDFASEKADLLLTVAQKALVSQPTLEDNVVTFEVGEDRPLHFVLLDGQWYIKN